MRWESTCCHEIGHVLVHPLVVVTLECANHLGIGRFFLISSESTGLGIIYANARMPPFANLQISMRCNAINQPYLYPELPHQPFLSAPTPPNPAPKSPALIQKGKPKGKTLLCKTRLKRPDHNGAAVNPATRLIRPIRT